MTEIKHYGIKGMEWGKRRWQNEDGSLTPAGKIRYNQRELTEADLKDYDNYMFQYTKKNLESDKSVKDGTYRYDTFDKNGRGQYSIVTKENGKVKKPLISVTGSVSVNGHNLYGNAKDPETKKMITKRTAIAKAAEQTLKGQKYYNSIFGKTEITLNNASKKVSEAVEQGAKKVKTFLGL